MEQPALVAMASAQPRRSGASTTGSPGSITSGPLGTGTLTIGTAGNNAHGGGLGVLNSPHGCRYAGQSNRHQRQRGLLEPIRPDVRRPGESGLDSQCQFLSQLERCGRLCQQPSSAGSNVTFSGVISSSSTTAGISLGSGSTGGLTLSNTNNSYMGPTGINYGTLIAGGNAPASGPGVFGNASSAITINEGYTQPTNSYYDPAALLTNGPYTIGRPVSVGATAGPTTLGTIATGTTTYGGTIFLNNTSNGVTLSSPAGGAVLFSGNITGNGTGAMGIAAPSNIIFSGSNILQCGNQPRRRHLESQRRHDGRQRSNQRQRRLAERQQRRHAGRQWGNQP